MVKKMHRLLALHGPNLDRLGEREPDLYGTTTLAEIDDMLERRAGEAGAHCAAFQSNAEAELIERVYAARDEGIAFLLVNPAGLTHTSVPLRDALAAVAIPFIEIHLTNPHAREPFRHTSLFSDLAAGVISGFGAQGYAFALDAALEHLKRRS